MTGENNSFGYDPRRVWTQKATHSHKVRSCHVRLAKFDAKICMLHMLLMNQSRGGVRLTLFVRRLPEQYTWLIAIYDGAICRRNIGRTMTEVALKFMDIIRAFATTTRMLAIYGIYDETAGAYTQDHGILKYEES
jgi:hypothetical protein